MYNRGAPSLLPAGPGGRRKSKAALPKVERFDFIPRLCWRKSGSDSERARRLIFCAQAESTGSDKQAADTATHLRQTAPISKQDIQMIGQQKRSPGTGHRFAQG